MYSVTKRIDFCYGHRLLDYDGICKHPHGHNAVAEIEVRTDRLDNRNMNAAFLISRDREAAFDSKVKTIASRFDKLTFKYTGPWPPYNFVNIRLKLERA